MSIQIGVDVGGAFTDAAVAIDGEIIRGKAYSTKDVTSGILNALRVVQDQVGATDEAAFFKDVSKFVLGNTIVTNAVDELKFARVGLLVTAGFRDTLRIARSSRGPSRDAHQIRPRSDIVDRTDIVEIRERIDAKGEVIVPLDLNDVRAKLEQLAASGVKAFAVCFLWAFRNMDHEAQVGELIRKEFPHIPFTLSSEIAPVYREYERMVTTVLDAAVKPIVATHFKELVEALRNRGLRTSVKIMQVDGGFVSAEEASKAPIKMFNSGPAGGAEGARRLSQALSVDRLITADMGGTSFDAAVILDGEYRVLPRAEFGEFPTTLTAVDIASIGAGGGSIAWIDSRGLMRVGPHSAGSEPGPACYGRGGSRPTVTDASVVLGLLDPDYFLGGAIKLDKARAVEAIRTTLSGPLGLSDEQSAAGIHRLTVHQMANAIRTITINRGHDPRDFTMVSFGGACGLFAAAIARECDVSRVIVPVTASVFSAYGLLHSNSVFTVVQTTPFSFSQNLEKLEEGFERLEGLVQAWFDEDGIPTADREIIREADMKFAGQIFDVTTRMPAVRLSDDRKEDVRKRFVQDYEAEFGVGTAWTESDLLVTNSRLKGIGRFEIPNATVRTGVDGLAKTEPWSTRRVTDPMTGGSFEVQVFRGLAIDQMENGPLIIEEPDTTIYVPERATVHRDNSANYVIDLASSSGSAAQH
ncbi:hydantoinase/oxoprolinase family protein [Chelatococcus asaccharovorans]|uniref:hydantoinase/oxoprolinase family protein n=1 Tax=Chelatococcus asaccharovorans TaxID=28210 RepID=UPI00224C66C1|nr:hydantoinase/oxoprolinase family protein [Chelatococcus asaccharovorans]CAH1666382.1 N-methylhydantoinase A [Chelatococcus asaccharovorans]CAH1681512.1 N-methylhydantoinase A [Chelatococcus asaccharovorans]